MNLKPPYRINQIPLPLPLLATAPSTTTKNKTLLAPSLAATKNLALLALLAASSAAPKNLTPTPSLAAVKKLENMTLLAVPFPAAKILTLTPSLAILNLTRSENEEDKIITKTKTEESPGPIAGTTNLAKVIRNILIPFAAVNLPRTTRYQRKRKNLDLVQKTRTLNRMFLVKITSKTRIRRI